MEAYREVLHEGFNKGLWGFAWRFKVDIRRLAFPRLAQKLKTASNLTSHGLWAPQCQKHATYAPVEPKSKASGYWIKYRCFPLSWLQVYDLAFIKG